MGYSDGKKKKKKLESKGAAIKKITGLFLHDPSPKLPAWHSQPLPRYKNISLLLCSGKQPKKSLFWGENPQNSLLLVLPGGPEAVPHLGVHEGAQEDEGGAQPVPAREGVPEVEDGEDEADELAERHHQGDGEGRALRGQDENAADADVPGRAR